MRSGTFSYGLYLLHFPLMLFMYGISTRPPSLVLDICITLGKSIESLRLPWKAAPVANRP